MLWSEGMESSVAWTHNHEIDGKLHNECSGCDEIRRLRGLTKVDAELNMDLNRRQQITETNRIGKEQLEREGADDAKVQHNVANRRTRR